MHIWQCTQFSRSKVWPEMPNSLNTCQKLNMFTVFCIITTVLCNKEVFMNNNLYSHTNKKIDCYDF